jgi:hypothetical protein
MQVSAAGCQPKQYEFLYGISLQGGFHADVDVSSSKGDETDRTVWQHQRLRRERKKERLTD